MKKKRWKNKLRIFNTSVAGFAPALRGMRNPHESWEKSDSTVKDGVFILGKNDAVLAKKLVRAGGDHRKFLRMITVWTDMEMPNYITNELDTYKVGTVRNSCSLQHKGASRDFTLNNFTIDDGKVNTSDLLQKQIDILNYLRARYVSDGDYEYFRIMRQLMPSSFNYRFTWQCNYEVLYKIYHTRKNHKLKEWRYICAWIERLPYFKELCVN